MSNMLDSRHLKEVISIIIILALGFLFYLGKNGFRPDLNGEVAGYGLSARWLMEARETGVSAATLFGNVHPAWQRLFGPTDKFLYGINFVHQFIAFSHPLGLSFIILFYEIFGSSAFSTILYSSIFGFLIAILTYFVGRRMYSNTVGLLSSLFLISSLFFLIHIKTAYQFYANSCLLTLLIIYLFYLAHEQTKRHWLYLSGICFGLLWLTGWIGILIVPAVLALFLFWNKRSDVAIFPLRDYLLASALALTVCLGLNILYSVYFHGTPLESFIRIHQQTFLRKPLPGGGSFITSHLQNIGYFLQTMFIDMKVRHTHYDKLMEGRPMIFPFVSLFLFLGLRYMKRQRSLADRMCLAWIVGTSLLCTLFLDFQHRYILLMAPVIYLIAGKGITAAGQQLEIFTSSRNMSMQCRRTVKKAYTALIAIGVAASLFCTYRDYYVIFASRDYNLWRFHGQSEMAQYIMEQANPKTTQILFDNHVQITYENFIFHTWGRDYDVQYWTNLFDDSSQVEDLRDWEKSTLQKGRDIIYVFSLDKREIKIPGKEDGPYYTDTTLFGKLHSELQPVKTIYYSSGIPSMAIYRIIKGSN